jgi:hypothetical protein
VSGCGNGVRLLGVAETAIERPDEFPSELVVTAGSNVRDRAAAADRATATTIADDDREPVGRLSVK